jgi:CHAT domain-containing protein/lipopolysaccharide biosynthesis regulator YciM
LSKAEVEKAESYLTVFFQSADSLQKTERTSDYFSLKGNIENEKGNLKLALDYHKKALSIRSLLFGQDHKKVAASLSNLGKVFLEMGLMDEAKKYFFASLTIHKRLKTDAKGDSFALKLSMGKMALLKGEFSSVKRWINELEHIDSGGSVNTLLKSSRILQFKSDYFAAIGKPDSAEYCIKTIIDNLKNSSEENDLLLLFYQHKYAITLFHSYRWKEAQTIAWNNIRYLDSGNYTSQVLKGKCFQLLGVISSHIGDYSSAVDQLTIALQYVEKSVPEKFEVKLALSNAYKAMGQMEETLRLLNEVHSEMLSQDLKFLNLASIQQWLYLNFGDCYLQQSLLEPAEYFYQEALKVAKRSGNQKCDYSDIYGKLVETCIKGKDIEQAVSLLKKLDQIKGDSYESQLYYLFLKARLEQEKGDFSEAINYYQKIIEQINLLGSFAFPYEKIQAYTFLCELQGMLARKSDDSNAWKEVIKTSKAGIEMLDQINGVFQSPGNAIDLKPRFSILFDFAVESCFYLASKQKDGIEKGLFYSDQLRLNRLNNLMLEQAYYDEIGFPEEVLIQKSLLARKSRLLQHQYFASLQGLPFPTDRQLEINKKLAEVKEALQDLNKEIHTPFKDPVKLNLNKVQQSLKENQSLLQFHWTDHELFLFLIHKNNANFYRYPSSKSLADSIQTFYNLSSINPQTINFEDYRSYANKYVSLSNWIYNFLFSGKEIPTENQIILVPDGLLYYLPFSSLIVSFHEDPERFKLHSYLIGRYPIITVTSFQDYQLSMQIPKRKNHDLVCIAPDFKASNTPYGTLEYNQQEAKVIAKITGGELIPSFAMPQEILKKYHQFGFWHFSTHAVLNDPNPAFSFLVISNNKSEEKSRLFFNDLEHQSLKAEMVTLSACQTGAGKLMRGEGIQSMAKAFLLAGVPSVVSSLWNVNDATTPEIMGNFYRYLNAGMQKGVALQNAQLTYIEKSNHYLAHPYFWAGFQIHNNDRPVGFGNEFLGKVLLWLGLLAFMGCGIHLWKKQ